MVGKEEKELIFSIVDELYKNNTIKNIDILDFKKYVDINLAIEESKENVIEKLDFMQLKISFYKNQEHKIKGSLEVFRQAYKDLGKAIINRLNETKMKTAYLKIEAIRNKIQPYNNYRHELIIDAFTQREFYNASINFSYIKKENYHLIHSAMYSTEKTVKKALDSGYFHLKCIEENMKYLFTTDNYFIFSKNIEGLNKNIRNILFEYIYVAQDTTGLIKIGKAKNVETRMKTHNASNPSLKLIAKYNTLISDRVENKVHRHFDEYRTFSEFFNIQFEAVHKYMIDNYINMDEQFVLYN